MKSRHILLALLIQLVRKLYESLQIFLVLDLNDIIICHNSGFSTYAISGTACKFNNNWRKNENGLLFDSSNKKQTITSLRLLAIAALIALTGCGSATWQAMSSFESGNLINDPSPGYMHFHNGVNSRYIKIKSDAAIEDSIGLF